jgi:hypothetical protein
MVLTLGAKELRLAALDGAGKKCGIWCWLVPRTEKKFRSRMLNLLIISLSNFI